MESNVIRLPTTDASNLLAQARPFEPDPPSSQGTCDRCGYRGAVYAGRYGGQRCAVCFGIQTGWMPRGELRAILGIQTANDPAAARVIEPGKPRRARWRAD